MKKQAVLLYLALSIVSLFVFGGFSFWSEDQNHSVAKKLIEAAEKSGAIITDIQHRTSLQLPPVRTEEELLSLGQTWSKMLGITITKALTKEEHLLYQSEGTIDHTERKLRLIGIPDEKGIQVYIVLSLEGKQEHAEDIETSYVNVVAKVKSMDLIPQFSTCIRGIYNDKLSVGWQEARIGNVFSLLQANEIERLQDESVTSISGYINQWNSYIITNEHKMNVQVATHVDSVNNLTRITIGSPIITAEY
ncbi:YwmB family TATA-box binding protein [Brevibacillus daliensis]|uniref:YwmB family TATA-box binding protein n=1 Tax=Brevibacillus daliensis TaxID=2892995 RepID=UPI001E2A471F|nr:YwmB family TATA-box binding protein [Brevibacillus daliensis]